MVRAGLAELYTFKYNGFELYNTDLIGRNKPLHKLLIYKKSFIYRYKKEPFIYLFANSFYS